MYTESETQYAQPSVHTHNVHMHTVYTQFISTVYTHSIHIHTVYAQFIQSMYTHSVHMYAQCTYRAYTQHTNRHSVHMHTAAKAVPPNGRHRDDLVT